MCSAVTSAPPTPAPSSSTGDMSLLEHLGELRRRIIISTIVLIIGAIVSYSFSGETFSFLTHPHYDYFPPNSLIGTGPAEAFLIKIKVALFASFFLTSPILFYQLWLFVAPGLLDHEKRLVIPFVVTTSVLFILGAWCAYETLVPISIQFFQTQYASIQVTPAITLREHIDLMVRILLGCGLIAQTPVIAYFAGRRRLVTAAFHIDKLRQATVVIFIIAAIITPTPDMVTQCAFAVPLLGLYCLSIGIVWMVQRPEKQESTKAT